MNDKPKWNSPTGHSISSAVTDKMPRVQEHTIDLNKLIPVQLKEQGKELGYRELMELYYTVLSDKAFCQRNNTVMNTELVFDVLSTLNKMGKLNNV